MSLRAHVKMIQSTVEIIGLPSPLNAPDMISIVMLRTSNETIMPTLMHASEAMAGLDVNILVRTGEKHTNIALMAPVKIVPNNIHHLIELIHL